MFVGVERAQQWGVTMMTWETWSLPQAETLILMTMTKTAEVMMSQGCDYHCSFLQSRLDICRQTEDCGWLQDPSHTLKKSEMFLRNIF